MAKTAKTKLAAQIIAANPTACWRTLYELMAAADADDDACMDVLAEARPECGYRCDGDEGPHPVNGSPGCFYSGKCEP